MEPDLAHEELVTDFSDPVDQRMAMKACGRDHQGSFERRSASSPTQGVILPPFLPVMRRLSTVRGRHGLVDFEESMIILKLREVECSDRSATWFEFDPLLCSQRAKGAAPASVAG